MSKLRNRLRKSALSERKFEDVEITFFEDGEECSELVRVTELGYGEQTEMQFNLQKFMTEEQLQRLAKRRDEATEQTGDEDAPEEHEGVDELLADEDMRRYMTMYLIMSVRDPLTGDRIFGVSDFEAIEASPAGWLKDLTLPIMRVNGHLDESDDDEELTAADGSSAGNEEE